jgi:transcriptional regulator with XRE-family HTH domain
MPPANAQALELAHFLKSRRARLSPADVGWTKSSRRRVPGLRREEVAELAEIGVTWYTWLEQAREMNVSAVTLERIASALKLEAEERQHLFLLAGYPAPHPLPGAGDLLLGTVTQVLDGLDPNPAIVLNRYWDVVAWNRSAALVFSDFSAQKETRRNWIWLTFTDLSFRKLIVDWERFARCVIAHFRADSASYATESRWVELTSALENVSPEFRQWWSSHEVVSSLDWRKELYHPKAGTIFLDSIHFEFPRPSSLKLVTYTACPDTDTQERLIALSNGRKSRLLTRQG